MVLFAVPFCGPYSALSNFKYKVKLTPGPMKRGKAVKSAMQAFCASAVPAGPTSTASRITRPPPCLRAPTDHHPSVTPRERELMLALPDTEMTLVMMGGVKIAAPGMGQLGSRSSHKGKKK